ncbi:MAG: protein-tyrosine phosphatase [Myxococcota bacterium]|jgi:protein-tyrosine phosphatase
MAGEYPGSAVPAEVGPRLADLRAHGITGFVDLTEVGELVPYSAHPAMAGARYTRVPIRDGGVPADGDILRRALHAIDAERAGGGTVYVHCWGGVGRTGLVIACWLVRHGATAEWALDEVQRLYATTPKVRRLPRSPENDRQCAWVRRWAASSRG